MEYDALKDFLTFLQDSPTAFHTTVEVGNRCAANGFCPLEEKEKWSLTPGHSYFVIRGGSLCAFTLPKSSPKKAKILASHSDSPALKLKPNSLFIENNLPFLRVETYGSPILSTWINRDLAIAGRLFYACGGEIESQLIHLDHLPLMIPSLPIHLEKEMNEMPKKIDRQHHLSPLLGLPSPHLKPEKIMEELLGVSSSTLLGSDLFLVPNTPPTLIGLNQNLVSAYRLDNLTSVHASLLSLLAAKKTPSTNLQMAIVWNHEEVGSETEEGAASSFLCDILERIALSYQMDREDLLRMKRSSELFSIDMAHAFHPSYKQKFDSANTPQMGEGVVIKFNANQRYATNGEMAANLNDLARKRQIKTQQFASESNIPSGSTVGSITSSKTGIPSIDIGLAQLSMHAARELISAEDHLTLCKLLKEVLQS